MGETHGEVDSRTTPDANWDLIISSSSPINALGGCLTGMALPVSIECFKTVILPKSSGEKGYHALGVAKVTCLLVHHQVLC